MLTQLLMSLVFSATAHAAPHSSPAAADPTWKIMKLSWSAADERNYQAFIQALGSSGCNTITKCLQSPANPYRASDDPDMAVAGDCAKLAYLLRGYFAWKNGLPFSVVSGVQAAEGINGDLRYSKEGNIVTHRQDFTQKSESQPINGLQVLKEIREDDDSAMFRFNPIHDIEKGLFFDFYPVKIDRNSVVPGTMIYDPNGHVAIVYQVGTDGRVFYMDAHPDDSVTHGVYGEKFVRSRPGMGAGFKNFRPLNLVGATRGSHGEYIGGHITTVPFTQIPAFGTEQYYGTNPSANGDWSTGTFVVNGETLGYYDFVRTRLAVGILKYHPVEEMQNSIDALCNDLQDRVTAIDTAVAARINTQEEPARLPENIYGTSGDWETYSSPSRDARLKTSFLEIRTSVETMVTLFKTHSDHVVYTGTDLAGDLRRAYAQKAATCKITYTRTNASTVTLTYDDIASRLWALSFDPYHCAELRWGASNASELATCTDSSLKRAWYAAEQWLRNQVDRPYDVTMGFSLQDLQSHVPNTGVAAPPDVDLKAYLAHLQN